jgi:protocatechuate 3,4-dioxygenase beta subunit
MITSRKRWVAGALLLAVVASAIAIARCDRGGGDGETAEPRRATPDRTDDRARARRDAIHRAQRGLDAALPKLTLRGRVVDGADRPVPGVPVVVAPGPRVVASGADGGFAIGDLVPGVYSVEARAGDRVGGPQRIVLSDQTGPVTLRLYRGAIAEIEVVSEADGRPVPGADVIAWQLSMYPGAGRQQARTDERGIARLEGLTLVAHEVLAISTDHAMTVDTLDPLLAADGRWRLRLEIAPAAALAGRVVDEAGAPVAGATIELHGDPGDGDSPRQSEADRYGAAHPTSAQRRGEGATTGDDGRFRIGIPAGRWAVSAARDGYLTAVSPALVSDGRTAGAELTLVLTAGRRVAGVVVDGDDRPVPGAELEVRWSFGSRVERRARSDGAGRFDLTGLPPGKVAILAIGAAGSSPPVHLDLSHADPDEELILTLENDGRIDGVVRDPAGRPVRDAEVVCVEIAPSERAAHTHPFAVTADGDGRFVFQGVSRSRRYAITAARPHDGDGQMRTTGGSAVAGDHVELVIPDDGAVTGAITVAGKAAPAGVMVALRGVTRPARLERGGRFRIVAAPGPYALVVEGPGLAEHVVEGVAVEPGRDVDLGTIDVARGRRIAGRVVRGEGRGVVGAEVGLVPDDGGRRLSTVTGDDGRFEAIVPAGTALRVRARQRSGRVSDEVRVDATGDAADLVLRFDAGGTIEGDAAAGGEPLSGAYVFVRRPDDHPDQPVTYTQTDDAGYFVLKDLPAGSYLVELQVPGVGAERVGRDVTVATGASAFVLFQVPAVGSAP